MNNTSLLDLLLDAVLFKYHDDPCAPGVSIAKLHDGRFYASIVRYKEQYGKGKEVIHQATESSSDIALKIIAHQFVFLNEKSEPTPIEKLRNHLGPPLSPENQKKMRTMFDLIEDNWKNGIKE